MTDTLFTAVRRFQFCAGHRVMEHGSKCRHLHGHNYVAFVYAEATRLDHLGMVVDFGDLKTMVGTWIDDHWDHGFIIHTQDTAAIRGIYAFTEQERVAYPPYKPKLFLLPTNPTAENLAAYLLTKAQELFQGHPALHVTKVVLWETENCYAEVADVSARGPTVLVAAAEPVATAVP